MTIEWQEFLMRGDGPIRDPEIVGTFVVAEVGTFLSFVFISVGLLRIARRVDLSETRLIEFGIYLFAALIAACGVDHLLSAVSVFFPAHRLIVAWKVATVVVAMTALGFFYPIMREVTSFCHPHDEN